MKKFNCDKCKELQAEIDRLAGEVGVKNNALYKLEVKVGTLQDIVKMLIEAFAHGCVDFDNEG